MSSSFHQREPFRIKSEKMKERSETRNESISTHQRNSYLIPSSYQDPKIHSIDPNTQSTDLTSSMENHLGSSNPSTTISSSAISADEEEGEEDEDEEDDDDESLMNEDDHHLSLFFAQSHPHHHQLGLSKIYDTLLDESEFKVNPIPLPSSSSSQPPFPIHHSSIIKSTHSRSSTFS